MKLAPAKALSLVLVGLVLGVMLAVVACGPAATPTPTPTPTAIPTPTPTQTPTPVPVPLLTVSKGPASQSYTMAQLQALPFIERTSWFMNSAGNLNGPSKLKGVALLELAKPLGGITAGDSVRLIARDGYAMTMSGPQLLDSKFTTFDSTTGKEVPHDKLDVVVVYEENGKPVDEKSAGPLRVAIMGTEQQATEGHWWVKWLDRIEIVAQIKPWTLSLEGVITEKMDNGTFESGAAPGCHGVTWTDADGHRWQGIPLWLLVGRVDDSISHSKDVKAFNDDVAAKGYQVQLIAADGYTQTFTADQIKRNSEMIVAFKYDGQVLAEKNYPLKLVGPKLTTKQQVGAITTIKLILP